MTRIIIRQIVWDEYNKEHIKGHNVTIEEVEYVIKHFITHKKAKKGRYILIGRKETRLLSVIIERKRPAVYYVVTARDAARKERSRVYEKEK